MLGWSVTESIGLPLNLIALPDERTLVDRYFARVLASQVGTPLTFTMNAVSRRADPLLMEVACVNRLDDPEIHGVVVSARDISERTRLAQEVEYFALHDRLTRLANRSLLLLRVDAALRQPGPALGAVLVFDIDDFKGINDGLGRAAADELLISVGERLRTCIRPGDTLARLGSDEFAIFCPTRVPIRSARVPSACSRYSDCPWRPGRPRWRSRPASASGSCTPATPPRSRCETPTSPCTRRSGRARRAGRRSIRRRARRPRAGSR